MKKVGRFHVLTDVELQVRFSHVELARMAVEGGADTIQFRQKSGSTRDLIRIASEMRAVCEEGGVTFVVNDRVDVALASSAHGVHLGQSDFPIALARKVLGPDCLIGGSASTIEEARRCEAEGADYIGFGPVFPTGSKLDAGAASGIKALREVSRLAKLPVVAIGGIGTGNVTAVMAAGVHGVAVISAVCCQPRPTEASRSLSVLLAGALGD